MPDTIPPFCQGVTFDRSIVRQRAWLGYDYQGNLKRDPVQLELARKFAIWVSKLDPEAWKKTQYGQFGVDQEFATWAVLLNYCDFGSEPDPENGYLGFPRFLIGGAGWLYTTHGTTIDSFMAQEQRASQSKASGLK